MAATNTTIFGGTRKHIIHITNDGTAQSAVVIVDASALIGPNGKAPSYTSLIHAQWNIWAVDVEVELLHDATTDTRALIMQGQGEKIFPGDGIVDPTNTGTTGDVLVTTTNAGAGDGYDIILTFILKD